MGKRILSVLLVFCMALTSLPATAWAAQADAGSQEDGIEQEAQEADAGQEEEPAKENMGTDEADA